MSILKNANDLKRKVLSKSDINIHIQDILYLLKIEIDAAVNNKRDKLIYKLPTEFATEIGGVTSNELRIIIYFHVLKELEENSYDVKLRKITKDVAERNNLDVGFFLWVGWSNAYKEEDLSQMVEYLKEKMH
jgi:hypothetical protein